MQVKDTKAFQEYVFNRLTFQPFKKESYTLYTNPKHPECGYCCMYCREGYYQLGIADYTILEDFSVRFNNSSRQLRFGAMRSGKTHFKLKDAPASSFLPSSFLVMEENIQGQQVFKAGEHLAGIELTIFEPYINDYLLSSFTDIFTFDHFTANDTLLFLPAEILQIISRLQELHEQEKLTPLLLEALVLECVAVLNQTFSGSAPSVFGEKAITHIPFGSNRTLTLREEDKKALQRAHHILTDSFRNPPTIQALSKQVLLSPWKLKYAFAAQYHMSIYEYTLSLKMSHAAMLLSTTSMSVEAIASELGYHYPGNFIQAFKKAYGQTPLKFRRSHS